MTGTAYKASDTVRSHNTVPTADPDLSAALDANSTYLIRGQFAFRAGSSGNFRHGFSYDGTLIYAHGMTHLHVSMYGDNAQAIASLTTVTGGTWTAAGLLANTTKSFPGSSSSSVWNHVRFAFMLKTDAAGTFAVTWSQDVDAADATAVLGGALMTYEKLP